MYKLITIISKTSFYLKNLFHTHKHILRGLVFHLNINFHKIQNKGRKRKLYIPQLLRNPAELHKKANGTYARSLALFSVLVVVRTTQYAYYRAASETSFCAGTPSSLLYLPQHSITFKDFHHRFSPDNLRRCPLKAEVDVFNEGPL